MPGSLFALALTVAFVAARTDSLPEDPRAVVRAATRAVEGDSAAPLRTRWAARVAANPADQAAVLGLATLARIGYDYPTAERLYRRLAGDSLRPDRYTAYALLGLATGLEDRGLSNEAGAAFARARAAARRAGDRTAEGEALVALSFVRARTEGAAVGLMLLDSAERLLPDTAFDLHSERLRRRAIILGIVGRPDAAASARESIGLARRAGDLRAEAHGLRAVGKVLNYRGEDDSAVVVYRAAEELFARARDRSWVAVTAMDRVNSLLDLGHLGDAKEALRVALAEGEASHNLLTIAVAHTGFGDIAIHVNDLPTAAEHLRKAAAMYEAQGDPSSAVIPRRYLAYVALAAGDLAAARLQALEVLEFYRRTGETSEQFELARTLAAIAMRERDWAGAERALAEARTLARRLGMPSWIETLARDEGRLALLRGDLDPAERLLRRYLGTLDSARHVARYDTRLRLADVYARRGDLAGAKREAIAAWDDLDRWRAGLADRELRVLAFQASPSELEVAPAERSDRDASVARVLGALAAGGEAATAFELAERRRARELVDRLVRAQALRVDAADGPPVAPRAAPRAAEPVTAADVAGLLPDDSTALLEFVAGDDESPTTLFVARRGGVRAHVLPPGDSLADRIRRFVALLEAGEQPGELARSLGMALLGRALDDLGPAVARVVVVPDGPLHRVPWDALRLPDGRHVVERYAVSIAPSAAVVAALWRRGRVAQSPAPLRLLAFGDPTFAGGGPGARTAASETYRTAFDSVGGLARLEASAREARLVARYAPAADVRLGEAASAAFLKRASLREYRVLHFATHALVDDQSASRSALALAPGEGESGFLGPGDLAALELEADLVVLSACRTAGGVVVGGEGVQGLTAPLLQAGARAVVATQWPIGDRRTVGFVESFYRAMARGLPVTEALRSAKLEALRRGAPAAEWGTFTVVGDPLVTIPLRAPPRLARWWPAGVAALALGALLAAYSPRVRKRRRGEAR